MTSATYEMLQENYYVGHFYAEVKINLLCTGRIKENNKFAYCRNNIDAYNSLAMEFDHIKSKSCHGKLNQCKRGNCNNRKHAISNVAKSGTIDDLYYELSLTRGLCRSCHISRPTHDLNVKRRDRRQGHLVFMQQYIHYMGQQVNIDLVKLKTNENHLSNLRMIKFFYDYWRVQPIPDGMEQIGFNNKQEVTNSMIERWRSLTWYGYDKSKLNRLEFQLLRDKHGGCGVDQIAKMYNMGRAGIQRRITDGKVVNNTARKLVYTQGNKK